MRSLLVALSLACASAGAPSRASAASRPAVLPRSALRLRGGEDADEAADSGAPSSLHEQMRDPAVVQQAMKMMQNPMIMEQMKTMMADPTVKARMQKMCAAAPQPCQPPPPCEAASECMCGAAQAPAARR